MSWQEDVMDRSLGHDANDLTPTVMSLFDELSSTGSWDVDLSFVKQPCNSIQLAVVLRALCSQKRAGWNEAFEVCKLQCIEDGHDIEDALYGML